MSSLISAQVVEPYAEALMSLAQANNLVEPFGNTLRSLLGFLGETSDLQLFLSNPLIKAEDKKAVMRQILGEDTNQYLLNFIKLLVDRRRIMFIEPIVQKYLELQRKLNNTVLAVVTSATELSDEQRQTVENKVRELTGAAGVEIKTDLDSDLIGGVVIKVGSQVYDASLRGQLRRISLSLSSAA